MTQRHRRLGRFPTPRQHGAWAMFLVPSIMTVSLSGSQWIPSAFLIFSFVFIFLSHQPASKLLRRWKNRGVVDSGSSLWTIILGGLGVLLGSMCFVYNGQWLPFLFGGIVAVALGTHLWLTANKEGMSILGELIGVFGLTASAPILYLFNYGALDARGYVIWMVNFLYFGGSIFYIKLKLRIQPTIKAPSFYEKIWAGVPLIAYSGLLFIYLFFALYIRGYSWLYLWAFSPFFLKNVMGVFVWYTKKQAKPNRVGIYELFHSLFFLLMNIMAFQQSW